jgi:hypothetical protein
VTTEVKLSIKKLFFRKFCKRTHYDPKQGHHICFYLRKDKEKQKDQQKQKEILKDKQTERQTNGQKRTKTNLIIIVNIEQNKIIIALTSNR